MLNADAKMSLETNDVLTDEDCEELGEDCFSFSADVLEKMKRTKRSSGSPYLSSMNMNPRRAAVAAWRLPRASLGDTRGDPLGGSGPARITSLSNGHDVSQTMRSEFDVTPELLKQTLRTRKHKLLLSGSNGFTGSTGDYREKESMYDEIIRLKKSLQEQKSDRQQMKAKLRRLEEDNAKREKQIEELLDPTKGSEYTRSLVDKKKEGSVVLNGLKQRVLKLEQQCREKEKALSKLQSELRTTNLEELKITVETYFEEIQRLRMLLDAAEKSSRAESKCSQRQQKALSSTVHRLSGGLKQLQQENAALREELDTEGPAGGIKGYREWSKQRLLRRLLEVEKRLEDSRGPAPAAQRSGRLDRGVQATRAEAPGFAMATEATVSAGTATEGGGEVPALRERLDQLEKEKVELQQRLSSKEEELRQSRTEREESETEAERWKAEQTNERGRERQRHTQELEQLLARIQTLEEKSQAAHAELPPAAAPEDHGDSGAGVRPEEGGRRDATGGKEEEEEEEEEEELGAEEKEREKSALVIQRHWRQHSNRDIVMLQSAMRAHLLRDSRLKETHNKAVEATIRSEAASSAEGGIDVVALTTIQSSFRGHLARCIHATESSGFSLPSPLGNDVPTPVKRRARSTHPQSTTDGGRQAEEEDPGLVSSTRPSRTTPPTVGEAHSTERVDSDDSDDIIVSPSRARRGREVFIL
ncbi:IQ domain-containing protein E isoform X2 [Pungitius pungitius]|uniref:IQ domain-containing protein E isoform X2 n=1 Tax=Pungitius pungitius TaxID=134920 RepID=UPI002E1170E5